MTHVVRSSRIVRDSVKSHGATCGLVGKHKVGKEVDEQWLESHERSADYARVGFNSGPSDCRNTRFYPKINDLY